MLLPHMWDSMCGTTHVACAPVCPYHSTLSSISTKGMPATYCVVGAVQLPPINLFVHVSPTATQWYTLLEQP